MNIQVLLNKLINRADLTVEEASFIASSMLENLLPPAQIAAILTALSIKGETSDELLGFILVMQHKMLGIKIPKGTIDVCGTGGDKLGTFNISTAVAFVVAGCGIKVAKHGNRAVTGRCGSADALEALGVNIALAPGQAEKILEKVGMVFLFAPLFHPAFKHVGAVRKELGFKTIFNFIGPFANPGRVTRQIIGVASESLAKKLAETAARLNYEHLLIVSGKDGLDEISLFEKTTMFEVRGEEIKKKVIDPTLFRHPDRPKRVEGSVASESLVESDLSASLRFAQDDNFIKGGGVKVNVKIIKNILSGEKGHRRDIVVLNSAFALYAAGKVKDPKQGILLAEKSIDTGSAKKVLDNLVNYTHAYLNIEQRVVKETQKYD